MHADARAGVKLFGLTDRRADKLFTRCTDGDIRLHLAHRQNS